MPEYESAAIILTVAGYGMNPLQSCDCYKKLLAGRRNCHQHAIFTCNPLLSEQPLQLESPRPS